jgi:glyoxylase-like metal-dependent hydrolase (beta-lactamase superfamily II)
MAIEMKDHWVVVEAPLFEERSAAVIQALEQKVPGKPVKYLVVTHFHIDHSGGVRAYAAKGATILAHESNVAFLNEVMSRPKTVRPDSLTSTGVKAVIEGVGELRSLTDGERTVDLRHIPNPHSTGMLAVYLPADKLVFASDIYSPGNPVQPGDPNASALLTALTGAQLAVDRLVGGHGSVGPFRDLARVDAPPAPGS